MISRILATKPGVRYKLHIGYTVALTHRAVSGDEGFGCLARKQNSTRHPTR
jgi:hypothetical protein